VDRCHGRRPPSKRALHRLLQACASPQSRAARSSAVPVSIILVLFASKDSAEKSPSRTGPDGTRRLAASAVHASSVCACASRNFPWGSSMRTFASAISRRLYDSAVELCHWPRLAAAAAHPDCCTPRLVVLRSGGRTIGVEASCLRGTQRRFACASLERCANPLDSHAVAVSSDCGTEIEFAIAARWFPRAIRAFQAF